MRVNRKIVIDLLTDRVIERDSYDYRGPVAELVTGSTPVKYAEWQVKGGVMEVYQSTVNPGSIAAAAEELETFAITGARSGDIVVSAEAEDPDVNALINGAKVTATDVVTVWIMNNYGVTTAVDAGTATINITILKRTVPPSA